MNSVKIISISASLLMLNGCSLKPVEPTPSEATSSAATTQLESAKQASTTKSSTSSDAVIAQDFVNIMVQIDALSPWSTQLQFGPPLSELASDAATSTADIRFSNALRLAAEKSGYTVQTVDDESGDNFVSFTISDAAGTDDGDVYTYDLSVGEVDFRRVYKPLPGGRVEPYKPMLVRGADVVALESDDAIFTKHNNEVNAELIAQTPDASVPVAQRSSFDSPVANEELQTRQPFDTSTAIPSNALSANTTNVAASEAAATTTTAATAPNAEGFATVRKINIAVSGQSNYENLLADKQNVAEEILIFGDDSYVLGARNKKILSDVMDSFDPETDVVSVVGCSTGVTKIANGNAALAIGRANRVKEALLYSGIPHDKIYDEGCWSPTPNSTPFPNRGVVITVKRNVNKS